MNILVSVFDGHVHSFLLDILDYRVAVFEPCRFCQAVFQSNCIHWQIVQEFYFPLLNTSLPASISVFHLSHFVECVESHYCVICFFLMTVRLYDYWPFLSVVSILVVFASLEKWLKKIVCLSFLPSSYSWNVCYSLCPFSLVLKHSFFSKFFF